jgi:hypothetical protein
MILSFYDFSRKKKANEKQGGREGKGKKGIKDKSFHPPVQNKELSDRPQK